MRLFDDLYRTSVVPALMGVFADAELWQYWGDGYGTGQPMPVVVAPGVIETRIEETLEREKKVRQQTLTLTSDPHDEDYPGLEQVAKRAVFESPAGELWSVVDDEADTRSGSLLRVRVQFARLVKVDRYAELG